MNDNKKKELQSATFERLLKHLDERKDVQNIDIMNLAGFCRNCLSRWYREEAEKKDISITDLEAREHVYGMLTQYGKKSTKNNYFSLSLGNSSTKLHGL
tara:strand:+ start:196 stop:492 length:297 start_codon:yes stop_codon:yes gene_type:complete